MLKALENYPILTSLKKALSSFRTQLQGRVVSEVQCNHLELRLVRYMHHILPTVET